MEVTYEVKCYDNDSVFTTWYQSETSFDMLYTPKIIINSSSGTTFQFSVTAGIAFYDDGGLEHFMPLTDETMFDSFVYEQVYIESDTLYVWQEREGTVMDILSLKGYFAERVTDVDINRVIEWVDGEIYRAERLGSGKLPLISLPVNAELYVSGATCEGAWIPVKREGILTVYDKIPLSLSWDESKKKILISGTENIPDNMELTMIFYKITQSSGLIHETRLGSITFTNKDTEIDPSKVLLNKVGPFYADIEDGFISCESVEFSATFSPSVTPSLPPVQTNFTITIADGITNGTVSAPSSAKMGATVYVNIKPDDGYELDSFLVVSSSGSQIATIDVTTEQKRFVMLASKVTISATFKKIGISINLGARANDTNIRYAEIGGVVTEVVEDGDKYLVEIGEDNLLIEVTEKTQGGEFVKSQYFYVDMENETSTKLDMDSYMTVDDDTSIRTKSPMGIRFMSNILTSSREESVDYVIDEYGFIVANANTLGSTELTFDFHKYATGVAYNRETDTDVIFDSSSDEQIVFTAVVKNISVEKYKTDLVCKTYTKVTVNGEQFIIYGEPVVGNVYDTAKNLIESTTLDADTYNALANIIFDYDNVAGIPGDEL